jgi:hypothetical protein
MICVCSSFSFEFQYLPTFLFLRASFSPVPKCVEIGLLESSFSDPTAASRTPLLLLLLIYAYPHSFPLRLVGDRFMKADSSHTTMFIIPSIQRKHKELRTHILIFSRGGGALSPFIPPSPPPPTSPLWQPIKSNYFLGGPRSGPRKGSQKGAKTDAKTHQKTMPKLVSKKIRKFRKIHVFPKG